MLIVLVLLSLLVGSWLGLLLDAKYIELSAATGHIIHHGRRRYRVTRTEKDCTCSGCQTRIGNGGV